MKTLSHLLLWGILISLPSLGLSQNLKYSRIYIQEEFIEASRDFLTLDHFHGDRTGIFVEVSESELRSLTSGNIPYSVIVPDLTQYYIEQNNRITSRSDFEFCGFQPGTVPNNFNLGSMGGYLTFDEMKEELDEMATKYPNLISKVLPISDFETYEGRPIYSVEISNQNSSFSNKKKVLYTALHHAREPLSMQQLIYYMWYLLENYGKDPMVTSILNQTSLYFIPCVNPDGYVYNEQVAPGGGGMWRKNRRPLGNGNYGIDLNRNYGYKWGFDDDGSSGNPESELYRGNQAFSEPETQAVKWICEQNEIVAALNYHSYGDYLIYPWGYEGVDNSESKTYQTLAKGLSLEKRILYGTSGETVLYNTNGDADDWMFGETNSKTRIFSLTPEVGPDVFGFWPPKSIITELCQRELEQNLNIAIASLDFVKVVHSYDPILRNKEFNHPFYLYLLGVDETGVQSKIRPLTNNIKNYQESIYLVGKNPQEEYFINFELDDNVKDGEKVIFEITFDNGTMNQTDTITYQYISDREPVKVLSDPGDLQHWIRSENDFNAWGLTENTYYTAPSSITDSPNGDYKPSSSNELVSRESFLIPNEEEVFLTYKVKWDIKNRKDYARLLISTDNVNFIPLCGNYSTAFFDYGNVSFPVYTGEQPQWLSERVYLGAYRGQRVYFKWEMVANSGETSDGIFIDDMKIEHSNTLTAGESSILDSELLNIFPNPVHNGETLFVTEDGFEGDLQPHYWEIRDILGKLISSGDFRSVGDWSRLEIPIQGFTSGMYFFTLKCKDGSVYKPEKFMIGN
ncbi:M14 family metallopeptidase [Membranihabitans maritimus]|uniref:M14 family metallopeptidase n=1 Tax=Membranihabitans maritimus TaxID=2904244 RepID=UPI001F27781B|nr:M14 family metallopeptidase [Membranihabitans maritimus]